MPKLGGFTLMDVLQLCDARQKCYARRGSGSVRGPFGGPFGPISAQNFGSPKFKISKKINLCGHRRRSGGAGRRGLGWRLEGSAAAATAAQIETF